MQKYSSSIDIDERLWDVDIRVSMAHARMLARQGILSPQDVTRILTGLKKSMKRFVRAVGTFDEKAEDIHGEIESYLFHKMARRQSGFIRLVVAMINVATDTRLFFKRECRSLNGRSAPDSKKFLLKLAEIHVHTVLPG